MSEMDWLGSIGDVDESTWELIDDGTYDSRVYEVKLKRNKADTRNYFNFQWKLEEEPYNGRFQWTILSIPVQPGSQDWQKTLTQEFNGDEGKMKEKQEKIIEIFFNTLTTITGQDWLNAENRPKLDPKSWVGCPARLVVVQYFNDFKGRDDNKVSRILPIENNSSGNGPRPSSSRSTEAKKPVRML